MASPSVLILLTPSSLDAAVVNGSSVVRSERVELDPAGWAAAWDGGLVALDSALSSVLRRLRAADRARVSVIADTPTLVVDATAAGGTGSVAEQAAATGLRERLADDAAERRSAPVVSAVIGRAEAGGPGETSSVVVAATDLELTLQKVDGWVRRAGGLLIGLRPARSVVLHAVMHRVDGAEEPGTAWCYVGESTSAIGGRPESGKAFLRSIDIGCRAIAEPFARVERRRVDSTTAPDAATTGVAREGDAQLFGRVLGELFEKGFPARGRGAEGDPRGAALPLLAPVLQRLTIEIKQTLRYASGPGAKALGRLVLLGPGAAVPGLAEALRDSLQLTVESENPVGADEARRPFGAASTGAAALRLRDAALLLVPTSARVLRRQQALTRTLRVSVLAAAVVLAGEFAWVRRAQAQVQSRIAEHAGEVDAIRARREAVQQAAAMSADLNNAAFATGDAIGSRAEWFAVLAELSGAVGSDIELVELRMFYEAQRPLVSLGGFALENRQATEGQPSADALGAFVQRVQESPLVKRVAIGATSSAQRGGRPARRFAVQVELVALPPQHALPDLPAGRKMEPITRDKPSVDVPAPTKSRPG